MQIVIVLNVGVRMIVLVLVLMIMIVTTMYDGDVADGVVMTVIGGRWWVL